MSDKVKVVKREQNGVKYTNIELNKYVSGVACYEDKRIIIKGKPKITITDGSYKFGKEIQVSVCAHKDYEIEKLKRNSEKWNVIEIDLSFNDMVELFKEFNKQLSELNEGKNEDTSSNG